MTKFMTKYTKYQNLRQKINCLAGLGSGRPAPGPGSRGSGTGIRIFNTGAQGPKGPRDPGALVSRDPGAQASRDPGALVSRSPGVPGPRDPGAHASRDPTLGPQKDTFPDGRKVYTLGGLLFFGLC